MPGKHAENAGLSFVEKVRSSMFQALVRFKRKAAAKFISMHHLNVMLIFETSRAAAKRKSPSFHQRSQKHL